LAFLTIGSKGVYKDIGQGQTDTPSLLIETEREREEREKECVCVCVRERERERERGVSDVRFKVGLPKDIFIFRPEGSFQHSEKNRIRCICATFFSLTKFMAE